MITLNSSSVYSTGYVNRNFRIKAYGVDNEGKRINKLVGVHGLRALIGDELMNKFIGRALKSKGYKCACKLRRGLMITFYVK